MQMPMDSVQTRTDQRAGPAGVRSVQPGSSHATLWCITSHTWGARQRPWGHLGAQTGEMKSHTLVSGTLKYVSEHTPVASLVTRMCNQEKRGLSGCSQDR